ncbi:MAG TPA: hypothetical protein VLA24_13585, partial [Pseudomonadales bacterium]|nr:hypothetical protein [Pseudomonadales bacterium]
DANAIQNTIVDAKGDLIAASAADTPARLAVGSNYGFLQADSAQSTGLAWNSNAWTSYAVTVTASSGTFTTVAGYGSYIRIGKLCVLRFSVNITTNGTAGTNIKLNLPFSAIAGSVGVTREIAATGLLGQCEVSGSDLYLQTLTNGYPGASGRFFIGIVNYEVD